MTLLDHFCHQHDLVAARMKVTVGDTITVSEVVLHYLIPFLHVCVFPRDSVLLRDSVTSGRESGIPGCLAAGSGRSRNVQNDQNDQA